MSNPGTSVTANVTSPADESFGTRYNCTGWTGTGNVPPSGTGTSVTFTITTASNITWNWIAQYRLTVSSSPSAHDSPNPAVGYTWYDTVTLVTANVTSPADESSGTRYRCTGWTGTGSVSSGSGTSVTFTINQPSSIAWNWVAQYQVTFTQNGMGGDVGSGTVLTVGSTTYSAFPVTGIWIDDGTTFSYNATISAVAGKQYALTGVTGLASPIHSPGTATGNYKAQYQVTFAQTGLDGSATGTVVTINGTAKTYSQMPNNTWVDSGSVITYSYSNVSSSTTGKRFILASMSGPSSPITVTAPVTVTGNYDVIITLRPNGNGNVNDLSNNHAGWPDYYDNWECVNEATSDEDSTYVYRSSSGSARDTYATQNPSASGTIRTVTIYIRARTTGTGAARTIIRTHNTNYESGDITLTSSYAGYSSSYSNNPNTGLTWTWTEIDSIECGVYLSRTSGSGTQSRCTQVYIEVRYSPS